ncbi:YqjF family protein [Halorubellus salinus]|uniref:YqjF family protein n=1 Tax=Halorubellus salinus TaxID=755309 RepID=UPI001D05E88C|nr:DUF2071 domain-containing protein [Halorubellus salinus]
MSIAVRPLSLALSDACLAHWPVAAGTIRDRIPDWTEPDRFDDSAWVSAILLSIDRFDAFGVPVRRDVEAVILRTYVSTPAGQRAIHFLSLDVNDRLVADAMRNLFRLPAHHATVRRLEDGDRTEVVARRRGQDRARLAVTYTPVGEPGPTAPDTLSSFLVERERYVATGPLGSRLVGSVGHPPWPVQPADATVTERSLLDAADIDPAGEPSLVHYSPGVEMTIGTLERA